MNKIKVFGGLVLLTLTNFFIITTRSLIPLVTITIMAYGIGICTDSRRATVKRIRLFCMIGLSILLFQILFNQLAPLGQRVLISLRTILQISSISEIVLIGMKCISPNEIVSAFSFLPHSLQILLAMTFYFVPLLLTEQNTIRLVQQSRGLGVTLQSRFHAPIAFLIPLLHRVFQRSETISFTILSRGFKE